MREAAFAFGVHLKYERSHASAPNPRKPKRVVVDEVIQAVEVEKGKLASQHSAEGGCHPPGRPGWILGPEAKC